MGEVDLLDRYPRTTRDIAARAAAVPAQREIASRFGREYFDGERGQGYGGYRYDGRWVPVAERFRDHYRLTAGQRVLDVGCAKGFLLHDLRQVVPGLCVTGIDVSSYAIAQAMEDVRPRLLVGSAERLRSRPGASTWSCRSTPCTTSIGARLRAGPRRDRAGRAPAPLRSGGFVVERLAAREVRALAAHRADLLRSGRLVPALRGGGLPRRLLLDRHGVTERNRRGRP